MSVLHRITRHPITKIASKNASAMSSDAAPFKIRSVSYESPSLGGSIPRAANYTASENCVTSISSPIAKHPPRIVRLKREGRFPRVRIATSGRRRKASGAASKGVEVCRAMKASGGRERGAGLERKSFSPSVLK